MLQERFAECLRTPSDIQGHLQHLYGESGGIVLELGVREGISTSALLLGVERSGGRLYSVDLNPSCGKHYDGHALWKFINADSTDRVKIETTILESGHPAEFDLIFIDTIHTLDQVWKELTSWESWLKKEGQIIVHDVTTYAEGAGRACEQFAYKYDWDYEVRQGWNGLGILRRKK